MQLLADWDLASQFVEEVPPAPICARTSYEPSLVPAVSVISSTRRPVEDDGDGRRRRLLRDCVDKEALAVGGHVVPIIQSGRARLKQRLDGTHLKARAFAVHCRRHQLVVGSEIEDLSAVTPPSGIDAASLSRPATSRRAPEREQHKPHFYQTRSTRTRPTGRRERIGRTLR